MPRDLHQLWAEATDQTLVDMPSLSEQPGRDDFERSSAMDAWPVVEKPVSGLKLYPKALTLQDVDACCILEDTAFPPEQRSSREKVSGF
jgi:hypothetical protein